MATEFVAFRRWWLRDQYAKWRTRLLMGIAWRLPRSLVYWCFIRVYAHATSGVHGDTHPDKIGYGEVARRWGEPNGLPRT